MHTLPLKGCAPTPLASYLKALGILRLVSEQSDPAAVGAWKGNTFTLTSKLDREELVKFFLESYRPTPILAPWNAGSGFYFRERKSDQKDPITGKKIKTGVRDEPTAATKVVSAVIDSKSERLTEYKASLSQIKGALAAMGRMEAPTNDEKPEFSLRLRNIVSDAVVAWFDAAFVLTGSRISFPPLLGTGGNGGNMDFTSNFMQRLAEVFDFQTGAPTDLSGPWLRNAVFGNLTAKIPSAAFGQFSPGGGGGVNAGPGFDGDASVNPWDFVLMLEGALLFAVASVKRLEAAGEGSLSSPFTVKKVGVGYGSSSLADEEDPRGETWMPIWEQPVSLSELQALLSEGRAQVEGRTARTGVDFMRAVVSLGVDRGISSFQRFGFQKRNGDLHFAVPLDRVPVRGNPLASQLLGPLDDWLNRFRGKALGDGAPSSVQRASRNLEAAIVSFCKAADPMRVQELLIALGSCEAALGASAKWTREAFLPPIPLLAPHWLREANTGSAEFRLAAALASVTAVHGRAALPLRCHLEPVQPGGGREKRWFAWSETLGTNVVWREGDLADVMNAIFSRRLVLAVKGGARSYPDSSVIPARPADIAHFIEGRTDDRLLTQLLWGLVLVDFAAPYSDDFKIGLPVERRDPSALYALLKLCFTRHPVRGEAIPLIPAIHQRALAGDGLGASTLAARRLRASGAAPAIEGIAATGTTVKRTAAALLFSITQDDLETISERVLRPKHAEAQTQTIHQ